MEVFAGVSGAGAKELGSREWVGLWLQSAFSHAGVFGLDPECCVKSLLIGPQHDAISVVDHSVSTVSVETRLRRTS